MIDLVEKRNTEQETIKVMIEIYCRGKHKTKKGELCEECEQLRRYCNERINKCPFMETKTFCSNCKVHCYKKDMRAKVKEVMRYSGPRMMFHNPIMVFKHVIYGIKDKANK